MAWAFIPLCRFLGPCAPCARAGVDPAAPAAVAAAQVRAAYPPRGGIRLLGRSYLEGDLPAVERYVVEEYVLGVLTTLSGDRCAARAHLWGGCGPGRVRNESYHQTCVP